MGDLFIGQSLTVDNDAVFFLLRFGGADNVLQRIEFGSIDIVKLQKLIVINGFVFKPAVDGSLGVNLLDLLHHGVDTVFGHSRSGNRNDGAIVQKFCHYLAALFLILAGLTGEMYGFGQHFQCSVRCKVENIAIGFLLAINTSGRLHAENGLHILRSGCGIGAGKHQHRRPLRNGHARGQFPTGKRDGILIFTDGFADKLQRVLCVVFLVSIALSGNIGNAEMHKHRVMAEHFAERLCLFDAGHHPQRMAEHIAVGIGREGIDAVLVLFCHQIQERTDVRFVYEVTLNGTLWDLTPAMRSS